VLFVVCVGLYACLKLCLILVRSGGDLLFFELGSGSGGTRKYLPAADDSASIAIQIPNGFAFGNTTQTSVYVRIFPNTQLSSY